MDKIIAIIRLRWYIAYVSNMSTTTRPLGWLHSNIDRKAAYCCSPFSRIMPRYQQNVKPENTCFDTIILAAFLCLRFWQKNAH